MYVYLAQLPTFGLGLLRFQYAAEPVRVAF